MSFKKKVKEIDEPVTLEEFQNFCKENNPPCPVSETVCETCQRAFEAGYEMAQKEIINNLCSACEDDCKNGNCGFISLARGTFKHEEEECSKKHITSCHKCGECDWKKEYKEKV